MKQPPDSEVVGSTGLVPLRKQLLGALAVAAYFMFWALLRQNLQKNYGPVFGVVGDLAFFFPIVAVVRNLGPAIGYRRNAWLLVLIPGFGFFVVAGVIYRLVQLPHGREDEEILPHEWTRGFRVAVGVGLFITAGFWVFAVVEQSWPVERPLEVAVAKKLDALQGDPFISDVHLMTVFDRREEALALVRVNSDGEVPTFRAWWFEPVRSWWRSGWRLEDESVAGTPSVVGDVRCSDDFHDWCRVGLPQDASGFVMEFENGGRATGSVFEGLGVAFVRPSSPPVRVVAYDGLGRTVADFATEVDPL